MMKKTFQMMFALLAAVLVLASCSKKESVATRLIPENAIVVGRLDVKQTIDKSGLDANSRLLKKLKSAMSDTDMSDEIREKMMDIVLNPNQSGIDFDQPVFFFFTGDNDNMGGFVGTIDNKGKLTDLINQIASESGSDDEVEEEDGVCRVGEMMVYTDDWFFIGDVNDDMIETLKEMAESGEGSMAEDESMAKLCEQPGVFSMLVSGKGLAQVGDRDLRQALQQLPEGLDISDMAAITDLQLNDGEMLFTGMFVPLNDEWQEYMEKTDRYAHEIDDTFTDYVSDKGLALFMNFEMNEFWKNIEKAMTANGMDDPEVKEVAKQIFDSLDGCLALDFSGFNGEKPAVSLFAKTNNDYIVETMSNAMEGDDLTSTGNNTFRLVEYDYDWDAYFNSDATELTRTVSAYLDFGKKDDITYLYYNAQPQELRTVSSTFPTRELKGKGFYARFNAKMLKNLDEDTFGESAVMICNQVANFINYAEAYYEGEGKSLFRIVTNDEDQTPLASLLDMIATFI